MLVKNVLAFFVDFMSNDPLRVFAFLERGQKWF